MDISVGETIEMVVEIIAVVVLLPLLSISVLMQKVLPIFARFI